MLFTETHGCREAFSKDPAVIRKGEEYFFYYSGFQMLDGKEKLAVGISRTKDLEHYEFEGFLPLTQECEANGVGAPAAYLEDGVIHLFYQTYGNRERDAICHATSTDGVHFEKDPTNPIFRPTDDWCCGRAIDADVVAFGDKLFLYIATRDKDFRVQMLGAASAKLGSDYSRSSWKQEIASPVLKPEYPWEGDCIEAPATFVHGGKVYLLYGGNYNCHPQQIGYATSTDGVHFEKASDEPFIRPGKPGSWNASESGHPYVFVDGDKIRLFFQGSPDGGKRWYISRTDLFFDGDRLCHGEIPEDRI